MPQPHIHIFPRPSPKYSPVPSTEADTEAPAQAPRSPSTPSIDFSVPTPHELERTYLYSAVCLLAAGLLVLLMCLFDGQPVPHWHSNLQYGSAVIAIMSCFRIALKAVSRFRKGSVEAKLEDFKMFDEAATGLWGSLVLIWRMKGRHLACVGAAIMILAQGFETFSSGMVGFDQSPMQSYIPPHPRAETWNHYVAKSKSGESDTSLHLSTKAAIYDGIIAQTMASAPASCLTLDCTWPPFPTLAVCSSCVESYVKNLCNSHIGCTYIMPSGTSIFHGSADADFKFKVAPSNGSVNAFASNSQPYISIFDVLSASRDFAEIKAQAHECALWFCLQSFNVSVTNGIQTSTVISSWSKTDFSAENSARSDELTFVDIPPNLYALKTFIDVIMAGNASGPAGAIEHSSDWIEAVRNAAPNLDSWIARLALSMTNEIRRTGTLSTVPDTNGTLRYAGIAYVTSTHVRVNWYWVIYPFTLMFLAFCYLAQTVWRTARDQVCAWKGDSLPMLFCHVEPSVYAQVGDGMDMPEGLVGRVGKIRVELVRRDDGLWVFREPIDP
ncbi:hypothetical protein F5B19DRAFT_504354 [Rostrohypoxylon terebratum]|nr:hypothetical protein F5B19DRAFT_504354 [Rostrohypoxylon terebratum]